MGNNIVTVNVAQQLAPIPSTLQKTGCFVSQGGTVLTVNQSSFLTQLSDLTALLVAPSAVSSVAWLAGVVTVTTAAPHPYPVGALVLLDLAGFTPAGYNGTFWCTISSTTQFTFSLGTNPGAATVEGTVVSHSVAELQQMADTHFAQGYQQGVYVLELGPGSVNQGVTALQSYLTDFPNNLYRPGATGYFYTYLVPRAWDGNANFIALATLYQSTTARTYFFVTTTLQNYGLYTNLQKAIFATVEAPNQGVHGQLPITGASYLNGELSLSVTGNTVAKGEWFQVSGCVPTAYNGWRLAGDGTNSTTIVCAVASDPGALTQNGVIVANRFASSAASSVEFSAAAIMWNILNWAPSDTNKVPPLSFTFLFGVTPFPVKGMGATLTALKNASVNIVGTGAEGGITDAMVLWGHTMDGKPFNYWYCADWVAINADIQLANAVINGSNDPINPLYYNQNGIDRLQAVLAGVVNQAVTFGLVLFTAKQTALTGPELTTALATNKYVGSSVVNAVPFIPYSQSNPYDYAAGLYQGFSARFTPLRGFEQIVINLLVSEFVTQ